MSKAGGTRRLTAIVSTDVVGYSRQMAADESGTLARLQAHRKSVIAPKTAEHRGRLVKLMGDGALLEFASIVDAVNFAIDVMRSVAEANAGIPQEDRIDYRVGINIGDVIADGDDIYGDGVNVAARLESLAEPGGIVISEMAHAAIRGKVDARTEFMGTHEVKNIPEPVRAYRIVCGTDGANEAGTGGDRPEDDEASIFDQAAIAVLPFDNMSTDPDDAFFVDGLTEDIITALSAWRSFPVIARNSTFAYKGQSPDIRQVGRELGARYVLEGSMRKGGGRARITAQLIDARTGHHLWAERYDRQLEDIFAVQDEITHRIAGIVAPEVERAEQNRLVNKEPANLTAWEFYQRGMALLDEMTADGNAEARKMFERAIRADPRYSLAFAGLAFSHNRDLMLEFAANKQASATLALAAAKQAVALDQTDSYAHSMLAIAYMWPDRFADAVEEAERAIALNPSNVNGLASLAMALDAMSRHDEAIERFQQTMQINPRDPRMHIYTTSLARAHVGNRDYEQAVAIARQTLSQRPAFPHAHYILAAALGHLGRLDEARTELVACDSVQPGYVERRLQWRPYQDAAENEHLHAGVHAARAAG